MVDFTAAKNELGIFEARIKAAFKKYNANVKDPRFQLKDFSAFKIDEAKVAVKELKIRYGRQSVPTPVLEVVVPVEVHSKEEFVKVNEFLIGSDIDMDNYDFNTPYMQYYSRDRHYTGDWEYDSCTFVFTITDLPSKYDEDFDYRQDQFNKMAEIYEGAIDEVTSFMSEVLEKRIKAYRSSLKKYNSGKGAEVLRSDESWLLSSRKRQRAAG